MKRTNLLLAAGIAIATFAFTSCQKDETTDPMVTLSQDDDQVTNLYDDVLNEADDVTLSNNVSRASAQGDYTTVTGSGTRTVVTTYEGDVMVKTITFNNFTNGNSLNGHVKNGVMIIRVTGGPLQAQFERTITFQNFTVDGIKIEGEKRVVKTAEYQYTVTLTGGKVTFEDGTTYTREFTRTRTWAEGYNTIGNIADDVYTVTGTSTGVNRKGYTYTHTITNPLMIKVACRWIVSGTIEMNVNNNTAILDYGNGECDNIATMTKDGKTYEFKLRWK